MLRIYSEDAYWIARRTTLLLGVPLLVAVLIIGLRTLEPHRRWLELQIRSELDKRPEDSGPDPSPPDSPSERISDETPDA
jgi:hypothetical protein